MFPAWKQHRRRRAQAAVLNAMWSHGLSRVTPERIATAARLRPAETRHALKVLEAAGLITVERRTGLWALSHEGQRVAGNRRRTAGSLR